MEPTAQNCAVCGFPCHDPLYEFRDAFGLGQNCSQENSTGVGILCNDCAGRPKLVLRDDPDGGDSDTLRDDPEGGDFDADAIPPGTPTPPVSPCGLSPSSQPAGETEAPAREALLLGARTEKSQATEEVLRFAGPIGLHDDDKELYRGSVNKKCSFCGSWFTGSDYLCFFLL